MRYPHLLRILFIITSLSFTILSTAQDNNNLWKAVYNEDYTFLYFQDNEGNIKGHLDSNYLIVANKWDKVIAVTELIEDEWYSYYMNKDSIIFGRDSTYYFDNTPDCEQEGYIRYQNKNTGLIGLFDYNRNIILPAEYDYISQVNNGWVTGIKNAKKVFMHEDYDDGCNHYTLEGGEEFLYNIEDKLWIPADSISSSLNLNHYFTSNASSLDNTYQSFKADNGTYYHFLDNSKAFSQWFQIFLSKHLTLPLLLEHSMDTLIVEADGEWLRLPKHQYLKGKFPKLKILLENVLAPGSDYFISEHGLNPYIFEGPMYEQYFDHCNNALVGKYPTHTIIKTVKRGNQEWQNHFEFLKTDNGYKLVTLTIRDPEY